MDFVTAVKTCFSKYADFTGRAKRPELWWFALFTFAVSVVLQMIVGDLISGLFSLAVLLPMLAVGARRLHDIGRSGWWLLIGLVPLVGAIVLIYFYIQPSAPEANEYGPPA